MLWIVAIVLLLLCDVAFDIVGVIHVVVDAVVVEVVNVVVVVCGVRKEVAWQGTDREEHFFVMRQACWPSTGKGK